MQMKLTPLFYVMTILVVCMYLNGKEIKASSYIFSKIIIDLACL
jgi:hypothetical protein